MVFRLITVEKGGYVSPWRTRDEVSITVKPSSSNNTPPNAVAEVNASIVKYGDSVTFSAINSSDIDGQIVSYEWKDEDNIVLSTEAQFAYTFALTGTHTIQLLVTDDGGLVASDTVTVTVQELQKPIAVISSSTDTALIGDSILFDANSSVDTDGEIVSYQWLDDTNTTLSDEKSFSHIFNTSGEHNITLVVMDDDGQEDRATVKVMIEALLLSISFDVDALTLDVNETVNITATGHYNDNTTEEISSGGEWIVADNAIVSIDTNGTLKALKGGITTVKVIVGEVESGTLNIEVLEPVILQSISISPNPILVREGISTQINVLGYYSDGTVQVIDEGLEYTIEDTSIATIDGTDTVEGLLEGETTLIASVGDVNSNAVSLIVTKEVDSTNLNAISFGNSYVNQIPVDATVDQYDEKRFCMIAGQIFSEDGTPLEGVKVFIHKHPEYGTALTDNNGTYVMPSDGGAQLTMRYSKEGYTTIDRKILAPVKDWVRTPDVTMLEVDSKATQIDLTNPTPQVHVSTPVVDDRGARSTTLVFNGASRATVTSPDGTTRDLTNINVRATEFKTPESMPSDLPPESAYTYCSDLQVDGVNDNEEISFDAPVVMYVENFLGFDVGEIVPIGYYDRNDGEWKASDNGAVVKLLDTNSDGIVDALDSTGDDLPNDLDGDANFEDEVVGIQDNPSYVAGKTYWRGEMMHFTPWDYNWPFGLPEDAEPPMIEEINTGGNEQNDCKVDVQSYVTSKSRVFHEDIPIAGTDMTLHYASNWVEGYGYIINTSINSSTLPESVLGVVATLRVGGRNFVKVLDISELDKNLKFVWDGKDILGNRMSGEVRANIDVDYFYPIVYLGASSEAERSWALVGDRATTILGRNTTSITSSKLFPIYIEPSFSNIANGWNISKDKLITNNTLIEGDGNIVNINRLNLNLDEYSKITTIAGNGNQGYSGDNGLATLAEFNNISDLAVDHLGNVYIADVENYRIRKIDTNGIMTTIAGNGEYGSTSSGGDGCEGDWVEGEGEGESGCSEMSPGTTITYEDYSGDGGPATEASLGYISSIVVDRFGNLYMADQTNNRIRKVDVNGIITTIAGNGGENNTGDGGEAINAEINSPRALVLDFDGNLYIGTTLTIRKIDVNGIITTKSNSLGGIIRDIVLDHYGNFYIAYSNFSKVDKLDASGNLTRIAGNGGLGSPTDGANAADEEIGYVQGMDVDHRGNLYLSMSSRIYRVDENNIIQKIAGSNYSGYSGDRGLAMDAQFRYPSGLHVDYNGDIYLADAGNYRIRKILAPVLFDKDPNSEIYSYRLSTNMVGLFNNRGRYIKTVDLLTNNIFETYDYDANGYIEKITNQFGEVVSIERDAQGIPVYITAPNGQVTTLQVNENGNLAEVKYEDNSAYTFTYFHDSLMDIMTDPNGNVVQHLFDEAGRIVEEVDGEGGSYRFLRNVNGSETFYSTILPEGETTETHDTLLNNFGDIRSTITLPTGENTTATFSGSGRVTTVLRDGISSMSNAMIDRLTYQNTLFLKEVSQPSGLKNSTNYRTTYDENDIFIITKARTITQNGKATQVLTDYNTGMETITTPEGRIVTRVYDIDTRLTQSIQSGSLTPTTYLYDVKGRITKELTGLRETNYTYDARGNIATIADPRGKVTTYGHDIMDRVTTVSYPDGTQEHFSYDNNGNLLTRTVPAPADHSFTYSAVDKRTSMTSPLQKATTYSYDKSKNLTQVTKPSGKTIRNTYNKGRLESTTTPEGITTYSYLFADKLESITQGTESFTYAYDGELLTSMTQIGLLDHTINFTYNNDFQVTSSTYAGRTENYNYDNDGLLNVSGSYILTRDVQNAYVTQLSDGALVQNRLYNNYGELSELSDNTFTYQLTQRDNSGGITQKTEIINGVSVTYDYTYDDMGRLVEVRKDGSIAETYEYDNNGNRLSAAVNGVSTTASYTLDDQLEVYGDNSYRYDDDGYLIEKVTPAGTTTYNYGTMGELKEIVTPIQTITYEHDANTQRVAKLANGTVVEKYLWADLTTLLAIYDSNDDLVQRFEYADQRMPISMTQNNQKYYLHYDQVGSLRVVTDTNHNIIKEVTYDTYGNILSDSNEAFKVPFGFAGGLYDSDTKLTRFGYRDYDAYAGKWTAKDPIDFEGGDSNLYGYVLGDPVNFIDSDGLIAFVIPWAIVEAAGWAGAVGGIAWAIGDTWSNNPNWNFPVTDDGGGKVCYAEEHTKNKRPSSKGKHEKGQKRKNQKYNDKKRQKSNWKSRK